MPAAAQPVNFRDPEAFERVIFLKQNAAWLLEQDLKRVDPTQQIALGTATDPYQPIERKACITRSLLEVFARKDGYRLGIVTKSTLIERDIDLLVEIGRRISSPCISPSPRRTRSWRGSWNRAHRCRTCVLPRCGACARWACGPGFYAVRCCLGLRTTRGRSMGWRGERPPSARAFLPGIRCS